MAVLSVSAYMASPIASRDVVHLDSVLAQAHPLVRGRHITRAHSAQDLLTPPLPVTTLRHAGRMVFACSAWILPPEARPGRDNFTKRLDAEDVWRRAGAWTPGSGPERIYCLPLVTTETPRVEWVVVGNRRGVMQLLRYVSHVGGWRRQGYGAVREWSVERVDLPPESALVHCGRAARHLPEAWTSGAVSVDDGPCTPPYWHPGLSEPRVRAGVSCALTGPVAEMVAACN